MDNADIAAELAERERQALIARHRARLPPPAPRRVPAHLSQLMDRQSEDEG